MSNAQISFIENFSFFSHVRYHLLTIQWIEFRWVDEGENIKKLKNEHNKMSSCGDIVKLLIKYRKKGGKYLQCRSSTKLLSLASTSGVFIAWQVNIEFKSDLCTWGHINRFSVKSPVCCSTCSSTISPFTSHRTCGDGRPVIKHERVSFVSCF